MMGVEEIRALVSDLLALDTDMDTAQVVDIQKLALKEVNSTIFKLKEYPRRFPIINRETHKLIKENNLIGLTFKAIEVS